MAKKKKGVMGKIFSRRILSLIQLLASIFLLVFVYRLNLLPMKYFIVLAVILLILVLLVSKLMQVGNKRKKKKHKGGLYVFSKLLCIVLSIFMVLTSLIYVNRGDSFISNISGSETQTRVIACYVLNDSDITSVNDLKNKKVGYDSKKSTKNISKVKDILSTKTKGIDYVVKSNYTKLADSLYDGDVDAIVADQSYLSNLEANHEDFTGETRIIYKKEFVESVTSVTTSTDVTSKPFIVYLTGLDTYGSVSTVSRTDVNLLACVNPNTHQILLVSVPRDTQVKLHRNGKMDKLTHSANFGVNETISTMEDFLDTKINYYAKTNFQGITDIVDAVDGITINSPYAFTTRHGNYKIVKGENKMNGEKALCFVRERYALPNGDFDRGKNQQLLLKALIKKCISTKIITNYENILTAVEGSFETNMSSSDIKSLIQMQLDENIKWSMYNVQLTGTGVKSTKTYSMPGQNVYTLKPDSKSLNSIKSLIDKIEDGNKITKSDIKE